MSLTSLTATVNSKLNSNIGCFEIEKCSENCIRYKMLNSNIGCFEIILPLICMSPWLVKQ